MRSLSCSQCVTRQYYRSGTIAEQTGDDQHTGITVQIHRSTTDLNTNGQDVPYGSATQQGSTKLQVWNCRCTALSNKVICTNISAQIEMLDNVSGSILKTSSIETITR